MNFTKFLLLAAILLPATIWATELEVPQCEHDCGLGSVDCIEFEEFAKDGSKETGNVDGGGGETGNGDEPAPKY